jgi:hypothetical protein
MLPTTVSALPMQYMHSPDKHPKMKDFAPSSVPVLSAVCCWNGRDGEESKDWGCRALIRGV